MGEALQSYTPLARPREYDSVIAKDGWDYTAVASSEVGVGVGGLQAFIALSVFPHNPGAPETVPGTSLRPPFNRTDTASYNLGPTEPGVSGLPSVLWTAWNGSLGGIRLAKGEIVPPSDTGDKSGLYPNLTATKLTHAFNDAGLLAIAVQKNYSQIELSYYDNAGGSIFRPTFNGQSPILWNNSLAYGQLVSGKGGLVIFYLKRESPRLIYARVEKDTYGKFQREFVVTIPLRVNPARLVACYKVYGFQGPFFLLYRDAWGRDCTLVSSTYHATPPAPDEAVSPSLIAFGEGVASQTADSEDPNNSSVLAGLAGGEVMEQMDTEELEEDFSNKIEMALDGGSVYNTLVLPDSEPEESKPALVSVSLAGGEVS